MRGREKQREKEREKKSDAYTLRKQERLSHGGGSVA